MPKTKYRAGQCVGCGGFAPLLCDYEMGDGKTCDAPICGSCAESKRRYPGFICIRVRGPHGSINVANDTIDYCPVHREEEALFG